MTNEKSDWWVLVLTDDTSLSGHSVFKFIHSTMKNLNFHFVYFKNLEGSGTGFSKLRLLESSAFPFRIDTINQIGNNIDQFDWGEFFFLNKEYDDPNRLKNNAFKSLLPDFPLSIKAVDGSDFYIYTREPKIVEWFQSAYIKIHLITTSFEDLVVPD